jgi:hypothetical protein
MDKYLKYKIKYLRLKGGAEELIYNQNSLNSVHETDTFYVSTNNGDTYICKKTGENYCGKKVPTDSSDNVDHPITWSEEDSYWEINQTLITQIKIGAHIINAPPQLVSDSDSDGEGKPPAA